MKFSLKQLLLSLTCASLGLGVIGFIVNSDDTLPWLESYSKSVQFLCVLFIISLPSVFFGAAVGVLFRRLKTGAVLGLAGWIIFLIFITWWLLPKVN